MTLTATLPGGVTLRPLRDGDGPALLAAFLAARETLRPYDPVRPAAFWTLDGQRARLDTLLREQAAGRVLPCGLVRGDEVLGCVTLNSIARGPSCSASVGYWVMPAATGRGLAGAALAAICRVADEELALHRIAASTAPGNVASQRVLARNGFERIGTAPSYLHIDGRWQDSYLYQRVLNDRPPPG